MSPVRVSAGAPGSRSQPLYLHEGSVDCIYIDRRYNTVLGTEDLDRLTAAE